MSASAPPAAPTDPKRYIDGWEKKWVDNNIHWDQGKSHGALVKFLNDDAETAKAGIPKGGWAFVPGCGQGYDVDLFARHGLDTIGLDVAPTGVVAANKWLESQPPRSARALVQQGDFFAYKPDELFDLIYDYTFLCALPPAMRKDWARRMSELSKDAPSTRLVTLMYPLNGDPNIGPPFRLTEEEYHELLDDEWEITWERAIPEDEKRKGPPGDEKLAVWKRK